MHVPGPQLLMRGLEQGPEMYVSTDWYPCEGSKDHTLRTWSAEQKTWKLQICIDSNLWSDWGLGAENLVATPSRLGGMGAGKAELSSFYQRRGHPSKAPCPPPGVWMRYCKSRLTDRAMGEQLPWESGQGSARLATSRKLLLTLFYHLCS